MIPYIFWAAFTIFVILFFRRCILFVYSLRLSSKIKELINESKYQRISTKIRKKNRLSLYLNQFKSCKRNGYHINAVSIKFKNGNAFSRALVRIKLLIFGVIDNKTAADKIIAGILNNAKMVKDK